MKKFKIRTNVANKYYFGLAYIFKSKYVLLKSKIIPYKLVFRLVLLYVCETWSMIKRVEDKIAFLERRIPKYNNYGPKKNTQQQEIKK